jgi:hypothetical protein
VGCLGHAEAAHAGDLDVEHAAGIQPDHGAEVVEVLHGFVQAHGSLDPGLQPGVGQEVAGRVGLLDHGQLGIVQRHEHVRGLLGVRVGAVGVDVHIEVRVGGTHRPDRFHVPAGRDLQLHAGVAVVHLQLHLGHEFVDRGLDTQRDAGHDGLSRATQRRRHGPPRRL